MRIIMQSAARDEIDEWRRDMLLIGTEYGRVHKLKGLLERLER